MRFSKLSQCFFPSDIQYPTLPADIVDCTQADFDMAMTRTRGETLDFVNGVVVIVQAPSATLAEVQADKIAELSAACGAQIYAGFQSAALGAVHTYPAKDRDQMNLAGSVVASLLPGLPAGWVTPFWCVDTLGPQAWAFVPHTAAQIQQVGADGKSAIIAALEKNAALAAQVMAAASAADVQAVAW